MNFHVRWTNVAADSLSDAWIKADQQVRRAITQASSRLDQDLQTDPQSKGESRPDGRRIYIDIPLGVLFRVNTRLQTVTVTQAWLVRKH